MVDRPVAVWHAAPISRVIGAVLGVVCGGALVLVSIGVLGSGNTAAANRIVYGGIGVIALVTTAAFVLRLRIELGEHDLTVVNTVRTTVIPLRDIQNVQASRYGLMIIWERGDDIKQTVASAVYKSSIPGGSRLRAARADEVVDRIRDACGLAPSD